MTVNHISRTGPKDEEARWPSPPDPGDLSKRIAQRRAELHLSQAQVATRAGLSLRCVEYLERYPARPAPEALRHLAAALQTTSATLLGGGALGTLQRGEGEPDPRVIRVGARGVHDVSRLHADHAEPVPVQVRSQ